MSKENVAVVRRLYEAAARRDNATIYSLYDPEIEWDASRTSRGVVTGRVVHGHDGLQKWLREWYGAWENIHDDLEELIEAGEHDVISVMTQRGRGRASGVDVADRLATIWTIRDGRIIRVAWFPTREEALDAAGLSGEPQPRSSDPA
jgi:ketosteroid isomerase-like protein